MRPLLLWIALTASAGTAWPAELTFTATMYSDSSYVGEHVWVLFYAENLTDSVVGALPLDICSPMMSYEVYDSLGSSLQHTHCEGLYSSGDYDTITARGQIRGSARIDWNMLNRDSVTGRGYFEPGEYVGVFRWYYSPARFDGTAEPSLVDTVKFSVLEPPPNERAVLDEFRLATILSDCRSRTERFLSLYRVNRGSRYADELLWKILLTIGGEDCQPVEIDRGALSRRFAIDYPSHPSVFGFVNVVYSICNRQRRSSGRIALLEILDSVPRFSRCAEAAVRYINEDEKENDPGD